MYFFIYIDRIINTFINSIVLVFECYFNELLLPAL